MPIITASFEIHDRGTAVILDETLDLPLGQLLNASLRRADGAETTFDARKELASHNGADIDAYLLLGATAPEAPAGSSIELRVKI